MINNSNILTLGASLSNSNYLEFFSAYKNQTTIIEVVVGVPGESREIICPDGCWSWSLNAIPDSSPVIAQPAIFFLFINGQRLDLQNASDDNKIPLQPIFQKPGAPYVQVHDTIQIQNNNFVGKFQFVFHRIMIKDE